MSEKDARFEKIWADTISSGTFKKLQTGKELAREFYNQARAATLAEVLAALPKEKEVDRWGFNGVRDSNNASYNAALKKIRDRLTLLQSGEGMK